MNRIVAAMFLYFSFLSVYTLWGQEKETLVLIDTDMGKIKVKLYNETPQHRDNFIKLINEGRYDGLIFHRIIKQFMVQGGDVTSKDAPIDKPLGDGDLGYTVPAEIVYPTISIKEVLYVPHVPATIPIRNVPRRLPNSIS